MIDKLIELAKIKDSIDIKRGEAKYFNNEWIINEILSEIKEVKEEIRPNNTPYLEDELGDILWGWLVLVQKLQSKGLVTSHKAIIQRALKKYSERINSLTGDSSDNKRWQEVKKQQQEALKREQELLEFQREVRAFYEPFYKDGDLAHQIDHADSVCDLALEMNKECNPKLIILAAYIHDIFNATDRKNHNQLAYNYVLEANDKFLKELSKEELLQVAHAVLEHRASFQGEFYSKLSEIISSADRGAPDIKEVVIRSMHFNSANAQDVYNHLQDKYGSNGYANYPKSYQKHFSKELAEFQKRVDNITVADIETIWKNRINIDFKLSI